MELFPQKIQNKFTSHLKGVIKTAEDISRELSHSRIGIEHMIFAIISQEGSIGSNLLGVENIDLKSLHKLIGEMPKTKNWKPLLSEELKNIFKKSVLIASRYKHTYIGTEHLLYAILVDDSKRTVEVFSSIGIKTDKLKDRLKSFMESSSRFSEIADLLGFPAEISRIGSVGPFGQANGNPSGLIVEMPALGQNLNSRQSALEYFCLDIINEIENKKIDPIIGREKEINKLINILNRKTKNNPVLVGEPGVGKTAVVQGLAQKIFQGSAPANLLDKRIYSLDLGLLVAGTVFRGEFEARLKEVIGEIQENPNAILFIDEIHTIIGAGSAGGSGSLDAANILKPSLSRGDICCIGATTLDEYRKHFKKDAALARRFQMVLIEEPSAEDTKKILKGLKNLYEDHHHLIISDKAIEAAVDLSRRFINDRFFPDKAFDVLDEASALARSRHGGKNYFKEIKKLEEEKRILREEKEKAVESERYDEALAIKEREGELEKAIANLREIQEKENKTKIEIPVSFEDVAEVITQMTGVPVKKLVCEEREKLKNLEIKLKERIVGQDKAIEAISKSIRRSRSGVANVDRPIGVFMFLGPTGVGKTELAKVLSKVVYESPDALIKVDMSEFMERHNISRLVGAPAGYVGYEEGGKLTEQVRLHPYSIILFDEIEKAHPDVFNLLLQIFEDGELTDAAGGKVNFRNTIIIMTSNIGTEELTDEAKWGFREDENLGDNEKKDKIREGYIETKDKILKELKNELSPEFINRIDKIIVFNPLGLKDIRSIAKIQFDDFRNRVLKGSGIKVDIDKKALDYIAGKSFDPNEGARLVRRNLQEMVEDLVSEKIINGEIGEGDEVILKVQNSKLVVSLQPPKQ